MLKAKIGRPHEEHKIRKLLAKIEQMKAHKKRASDNLKPAGAIPAEATHTLR